MPLERNWAGMVVDPARPHLGGYFPAGDPGSYYPEMWRWLVEEFQIRSLLDVGCGSGQALRFFRDRGCEVLGIDGIEQDDPDIVEHDYTTGPFDAPLGEFDLCWSCEFVEHVEERFMPNYLATFACAEYVLMTHAQPGQGGHHHVHCRADDYWIGALASIGYEHDPQLTAVTRELVPHGYWRQSGLAFKRAA